MTWWNRPDLKNYDALVCDGSVRSGKTLAMSIGFFLWSMARFNGAVFAICGKTVGSLRRNLVLHLGSWLGDVMEIREHRGDNRLVVRLGDHVNTYYLFGGQDEGSYMLIQGITLAGVLMDEAALMPRSFVEQAAARCSVPGSKMWFNCNPGSPQHWFYQEWILKAQQKNVLHLHFTMADNPGLDPAVRQRYERLYAGVFYRRYVLGQWCAAQGLIYQLDENRHLLADMPKEGRWYISVDYGTQNPFSAGLWCVADGKAYRVAEYYYSGRESGVMRTDEQYYADLVALAGDKPVEQVIIDPSASSFIATIRRHGRFRVRRARNAVLPGIQLVATLLQQERLLLHPSCKNTLREFSLYCWEDDRDAPKKENDHAMDDIRYFCMSVMAREIKN